MAKNDSFIEQLPIIGDFIGGIGDFFSTLSGDDKPSLKEQLDVSRIMAKYNYDLNMQAWNEQNAYNDPSAQMERLKNAGINPHAIAGTSSVAGNASGAPTVTVDTPDLAKFQRKTNFQSLMTMSQALQNMLTSQTQNKKTEKEIKNLETIDQNNQSDLLTKQLERESLRLDMALRRLSEYRNNELFKHNIEMQKTLIAKEEANIRQINKNIDHLEASIDNLSAETTIKQNQNKYWYGQGVWPGYVGGYDVFINPFKPLINNIGGRIAKYVEDGLDAYDKNKRNKLQRKTAVEMAWKMLRGSYRYNDPTHYFYTDMGI